jgi:hypothetical protein
VVKLLSLSLLALILLLLGGVATVQWMTMRGDTYPVTVILSAFWLGGLAMALIVFEIGRRLLTLMGAIGDEPEPAPAKSDDDDDEDDRPPPRKPAAPPGKPVAPALNMPGGRK